MNEDNVIKRVADMLAATARDDRFIATVVGTATPLVQIRRAGSTTIEAYPCTDGLSVTAADKVLVVRVGTGYVVLAKIGPPA